LFTLSPTFAKSKPVQPSKPTAADIVEKVSRSVVHVEATFSFQIYGRMSPVFVTSSGTGFVVDSQSRIATANHVVDLASNQHAQESRLQANGRAMVPGSFHLASLSIEVLLPNINGANGLTLYGNSVGHAARLLRQDALLDIAILSCE
jgi:hypothetical protein